MFWSLPDTSASEEAPIRIASIFSFTGMASELNRNSIEGVRMGVREINENGGLLGRQVELVEIDNLSTPIGSKVAADRAVGENVTAIIGAIFSTHSLAIARVAQANGIPMISNGSTHVNLTRVGDYIFRACYTDAFQGWLMARFARRHIGATRAVMFINMNSDYSMGLSDEFRRGFLKLGGRMVHPLYYRDKQKSYEEMIWGARETNPDVLFIPGYDESGRIMEAAVGAGITAVALGGDGWNVIKKFAWSGKSLSKGYYCAHWSPDVDNPVSRNFVGKFKKDQVIKISLALAYDAVNIMARAIRLAGSTDRAGIRDALAGMADFKGVTGTFTFDEHGDPRKGAVIMEIKDGRESFLKEVEYTPPPS